MPKGVVQGRVIGTIIFIMAASSVGCGKRNLIGERERKTAPQSQKDVGVLVEEASLEDVEKVLADHPQAQVRVLNAKSGSFEIFGVSKTAVSQVIKAKVENNVFIPADPKTRAKIFSMPAPVGLQVGDLPPCQRSADLPTAVLDAPEKIKGHTIELDGQSIRLGTKSTAHPSHQGALRSVFVVAAPSSSTKPEQIVEADKLDFTPDALGVYQAILLVQDERGVCSMDGVQFLVTANRPFTGAPASEPQVDIEKIPHLSLIDAKESWQLSEGEGILVAVVDSGVDYNHPLLAGAVELNQQEITGNGIDDDGNGIVDDVIGADFINGDVFPYDDDGHGTHVAGLALGRQMGMAKKARLIPVKAMTSVGADVGTISAAIRYAVDRHAQVINLSLGAPGPFPHPSMVRAMEYAESKGVVVVAAAGNGDPTTGLGIDIDVTPDWPASLPNSNLISVGAFAKDQAITEYSNFGKQNVDVMAPGGSSADPMISLAFENPQGAQFTVMSGTSMAAPVVSGMVAQLLSLQPGLTPQEVREILLKAGNEFPELAGKCVSGRHLDAFKVLDQALARHVLF